MGSPFPGMDPWLERPWIFPDLRNSMIAALRDSINAKLPPPYFTAIANRVWMEESLRQIEADLDLLDPSRNKVKQNPKSTPTSATSTLEMIEDRPIIIRMPSEEITEWHLELRYGGGNERLITSIEVLSLANKRRRSEGRRLYLKKQREILRSEVNLVEIDLLRSGMHSTAVSLARLQAEAGPYDYHVCLHRFNEPEEYPVYPIRMQNRLPTIPIPLIPPAQEIFVSLQEILSACYDRGLYARRVHYDEACRPPLTDEQAKWAEQILREKKLLPTE